MKFNLSICLFLFLFIFSCKKDVTVSPCESELNNSYFPMTVGSYWVYQWYKVDFLEGEETILEDKIDTISVVKDSLIGFYNYFEIRDNNTFEQGLSRTFFRRDSLGYLVNPKNRIFFSSTNFVDTFHVELNFGFQTIYKMELVGSSIQTPLRIFDCRNFQGEITRLSLSSSTWNKQYYNNYYSRGVGKIQENIFYSSLADRIHFHRRLIEYHIE